MPSDLEEFCFTTDVGVAFPSSSSAVSTQFPARVEAQPSITFEQILDSQALLQETVEGKIRGIFSHCNVNTSPGPSHHRSHKRRRVPAPGRYISR